MGVLYMQSLEQLYLQQADVWYREYLMTIDPLTKNFCKQKCDELRLQARKYRVKKMKINANVKREVLFEQLSTPKVCGCGHRHDMVEQGVIDKEYGWLHFNCFCESTLVIKDFEAVTFQV